MKNILIINVILTSFAFLLGACVKDEEGLSDYVQNYLDSIAIADTQAFFIDKPCETEENNFTYYTNHQVFTDINCVDEGDDGFYITAYTEDEDGTLQLLFRDKPQPGKYISQYGGLPSFNHVNVVYSTDFSNLVAHGDDTVYVEKLSGGDYYITLCDVRIENGFGGYYSEGNITISLDDCN